MNREEIKDSLINTMITKSKNKDLIYNKIKNHLSSSNKEDIYVAPINPKYLDVINTPIILTNDVYDALMTIDEYNVNKKLEVPFIIYGKRTKGGAIYLDDLYCDFSKLKESSANIDNLKEYFFNRLNVFYEDNFKERVIVLGHTHPFTGKISLNYSVSDLLFHYNYYQGKCFYKEYNGNLLLSLILTITKDLNFITYDYRTNQFYSFNTVYLQEKKKDFIPLSALNFCDD